MARPRRREDETQALFVRIPSTAAAKLDRASYALNTPKRDLIANLVARYVDPEDPSALTELGGSEPSELPLGRHWFRPADVPEVLTLAQVAEFLQVEEDAARELAERGELPGRKVGDEWRFSRQAVLDWLSSGEGSE
jgi:excisionase family DNA binding protein